MPNSTRYSDEEIEKMSHEIYGHAEYDRIRFAEGMRVMRDKFLTDLEQAQKKIEEQQKALIVAEKSLLHFQSVMKYVSSITNPDYFKKEIGKDLAEITDTFLDEEMAIIKDAINGKA